MTIVPLMSDSSIALRMAVTAAWSAPSRSPRPMSRAAAMAPASVARIPSAMTSLSIGASVLEMAAAREDHCHVVAVGDLDRHLVADAAAGLDDGRHPRLGCDLDAVGEGEIGVAGHDG